MGTEGWLGRVIRDIDPNAENVLTGVNFGRGLPRAMALTGVPVASVAVLETYGVLTGIVNEPERSQALDIFARMYSPTVGLGATMDYLGQTGLDALKGGGHSQGRAGYVRLHRGVRRHRHRQEPAGHR